MNLSWRMKQVCYPASLYYKYCDKSIFIEEGATQYVTPEMKYDFIRRIYGNQTNFWRDDKLLEIYVQSPQKYPLYYQSKIRKFSFDECVENIKKNFLDTFLNIFLKAENTHI